MENKFSLEEWDKILNDTYEKIKALADVKGAEYSGYVDRLANFRRNGEDVGLPMEVVWRIYAGKHWDSLTTYIKDIAAGTSRPLSEPIENRIDDLIVYLILFKCMVFEKNKEEKDHLYKILR